MNMHLWLMDDSQKTEPITSVLYCRLGGNRFVSCHTDPYKSLLQNLQKAFVYL